jgi:hypothetical protein
MRLNRLRDNLPKRGSVVVMGDLYITPQAKRALHPKDIETALYRHSCADWGRVIGLDALANHEALQNQGRVLSLYRSEGNRTFWVETDGLRYCTRILMLGEC